MTTKNTQVAKPTKSLKDIISSPQMQEQFHKALPKHLSAERFGRIAITALTRTPKLQECTPESLMKCLLDLSAMGLEPDGRRAHLIPYKNEATLIIDYKGLVELIRRSGDVTTLRAETVCANDEFSWINGEVSHTINWRKDRGEVEAVYAVAQMKSGETQSAVMTKREVEGIRLRSRAGNNGPWMTDWSEMAKKTAMRRLSKLLPLSSELAEYVGTDDRYQFPELRDVTPQGKAAPKSNPYVEEKPVQKEETPEAEPIAEPSEEAAPEPEAAPKDEHPEPKPLSAVDLF